MHKKKWISNYFKWFHIFSKNIKYASSYDAKYVLFVGEDELKNQKFKLRNLQSGEEKINSIDEIIKFVKNERNNFD